MFNGYSLVNTNNIRLRREDVRLSKDERIEQLISLLQAQNGAAIKELAAQFNVSEMTIRRDLQELEAKNIVSLIHGAAIFNSRPYDVAAAKDKQANEKSLIGQQAISLLEPNDVIIIDTGTTTEYVAKFLPDDIPLTVICYTTNVLVEIYQKPNVKIYFAGGYYHRKSQMFESHEGIELIGRICATKAFVSAAGISLKLGVSCMNQYEVATKHAIMKSALEKILLVDSCKFNQISPAYFADLVDFDTIITDTNISLEWIELLEEQEIKVHVI